MAPLAPPNPYRNARIASIPCSSRRTAVVALGRSRDFATESLDHAVQALNKFILDHEQQRERKRRLQRDNAKGNGAAEVEAVPISRPITFKASAKTEKLVKEPPSAGSSSRDLSAYLALPLDQYSLLDPGWISRSKAAPDVFILRVPLFDLVGLDLQPQISVKVSLDPRSSQVHFLADQFRVGDPRFDEDFKLNMRATLRHKPVPTLRPFRSIRRMWSMAGGRASTSAAADSTAAPATDDSASPTSSSMATFHASPSASPSSSAAASHQPLPHHEKASGELLRYDRGSEIKNGIVVQTEGVRKEEEGGKGSKAERLAAGPASSSSDNNSRNSSSGSNGAIGLYRVDTALCSSSSSNGSINGSSSSVSSSSAASATAKVEVEAEIVPSEGGGALSAGAPRTAGIHNPRLSSAPEAGTCSPATMVAAAASVGEQGAGEGLPFIEDAVLYVPASQWGRSGEDTATSPVPTSPSTSTANGADSALPSVSASAGIAATAAGSRGALPTSALAPAAAPASSATSATGASGGLQVQGNEAERPAMRESVGGERHGHGNHMGGPPTSSNSSSWNGAAYGAAPAVELVEAEVAGGGRVAAAHATSQQQQQQGLVGVDGGRSDRDLHTTNNNNENRNNVSSDSTSIVSSSSSSSSSSSTSDEGATALLVGSVDVAFTVTVPPALAAVPRPLLGMTGSLIARYAISSLLPSFLDLLAADYGRWSSGQTVAARSEPVGDLAAAAAANAAAMGAGQGGR